jgi:hypothetical protein
MESITAERVTVKIKEDSYVFIGISSLSTCFAKRS